MLKLCNNESLVLYNFQTNITSTVSNLWLWSQNISVFTVKFCYVHKHDILDNGSCNWVMTDSSLMMVSHYHPLAVQGIFSWWIEHSVPSLSQPFLMNPIQTSNRYNFFMSLWKVCWTPNADFRKVTWSWGEENTSGKIHLYRHTVQY